MSHCDIPQHAPQAQLEAETHKIPPSLLAFTILASFFLECLVFQSFLSLHHLQPTLNLSASHLSNLKGRSRPLAVAGYTIYTIWALGVSYYTWKSGLGWNIYSSTIKLRCIKAHTKALI